MCICKIKAKIVSARRQSQKQLDAESLDSCSFCSTSDSKTRISDAGNYWTLVLLYIILKADTSTATTFSSQAKIQAQFFGWCGNACCQAANCSLQVFEVGFSTSVFLRALPPPQQRKPSLCLPALSDTGKPSRPSALKYRARGGQL